MGSHEVVAEATTDLVSIDGTNKPVAIPADLRRRLEAAVGSFP